MNPPRRWDLLALGDPCVDQVAAVQALPGAGDKVLARALGDLPGGTTANAACAFARLGGRAAVFGRVGDDASGDMLRASLDSDGVDVQHLLTAPGCTTGRVIALIPPSGERALVVMPMAPGAPRDEELAEAARQARVVYLMPYALDELARVRQIAQAAGAWVAIDLEPAVAPDNEAMRQRLALADIAFFNLEGFVAATGQQPTPAALGALRGLGPAVVVVSLGDQGAMAVDRHGSVQRPVFQVPVADTTGAGDTFNAAFLLAYLEGQDLAASLSFACAAAAHAVTRTGARTGMPGREAVERLIHSGRFA
jgi:ribokinase